MVTRKQTTHSVFRQLSPDKDFLQKYASIKALPNGETGLRLWGDQRASHEYEPPECSCLESFISKPAARGAVPDFLGAERKRGFSNKTRHSGLLSIRAVRKRASRHFVISRSTWVLCVREPEAPVIVTVNFVLCCPPPPPPPGPVLPAPPQDSVVMRRSSANIEPTAPR